MKSPHLLNIGNPRKVKNNLVGILNQAALKRIEDEIENNVAGLLQLARHHYLFAKKQSSSNWRQRISRLYYAAYNAARAVRLYVFGDYSTEVKDHQRFEQLPDDFPKKAQYGNKLTVLREDRNICDYDHVSTVSDLVLGLSESVEIVEMFLDDAKDYLKSKGMDL